MTDLNHSLHTVNEEARESLKTPLTEINTDHSKQSIHLDGIYSKNMFS